MTCWPDFWKKWSCAFCLMQLWWIAYSSMVSIKFNTQEVYSAIAPWQKIIFKNYRLTFLHKTGLTRCQDFWNKWSRGFCLMQLWGIAYSAMESIRFTILEAHLAMAPWQNMIFQNLLPFFCIKPGWLAATTFDINGHGASVWCKCDELHIIRLY